MLKKSKWNRTIIKRSFTKKNRSVIRKESIQRNSTDMGTLQKRKREEKDERKRKYNVKWDDQVTAEDMEAYRVTKVHHEDPMKDYLN
ncbi:pre-mRNA-splicing factor SLU7-like protein [Tanacetum coccineum]